MLSSFNFIFPKYLNHNAQNCSVFFSLKKQKTVIGFSTKPATNIPKHSESIKEQRSLRVSVIGLPNAGKSTFINNLINHRVCPTSSKVHTTHKPNKAISSTGNIQLIFYDTPGLVTPMEIKKFQLQKSFQTANRHAIQHSDMIGVIHDSANVWTRKALHPTVLETLKAYPKLPSFLVLNKIDALKSKRILLSLVQTLTNNVLRTPGSSRKFDISKNGKSTNFKTDAKENPIVGWSYFSDVFMVSAITGDGLNEINEFLCHQSQPKEWEYPGEMFTNETTENLIVHSVRARLLDYLPQEIPYKLETKLEYFSEEKKAIFASVEVICPSARVERLICGESNGRLRQITERVTSDLIETFRKRISLTISTKAKTVISNTA